MLSITLLAPARTAAEAIIRTNQRLRNFASSSAMGTNRSVGFAGARRKLARKTRTRI